MNVVLVVAGGNGTRTGQEIPKQFLTVKDKPIIIYTLENLERIKFIDEIVVVVSQGWESFLKSYAKQFGIKKLKDVVIGGETRHESISKGINFITRNYNKNDVVVIMDANRPFVPESVYGDAINAVRDNGVFSIAAENCMDSMYSSEDGGEIESAIDRRALYKGQTPECGTVKDLTEIYQLAKEQGILDCTTTELCLKFNRKVSMVKGSSKSFKITTKEDIELFKALLEVETNNLI